MLRKLQTCLGMTIVGSALLWTAFVGNAGAVEGIEGLKFYGDGRARFEMDDRTRLTGGVYEDQDRDRLRYRLRVGFTFTPTDQVEFGARVTSGDTSDANSPHVILGESDNSDSGSDGNLGRDTIGIDRVYIKYKYQNKQYENISAFGWFGKETMPMWTQNEYFWDGDINPEGVAAGVTYKKLGPLTVTLQGGYFVIDEGSWFNASGGDADRDLEVYQGVVKAEFEPADITASYGVLKTDAGASIRSQNLTTTTTNDYSLASVQAKIKAIPQIGVTVGYDYISSDADTLEKGSVISVGATYKDLSLSVMRPDIETNAVTGFAQDNFPNFYNNFKGYEYKVGYKFTKNINADITRLDGERKTDSNQKESRTQFNVNVSF